MGCGSSRVGAGGGGSSDTKALRSLEETCKKLVDVYHESTVERQSHAHHHVLHGHGSGSGHMHLDNSCGKFDCTSDIGTAVRTCRSENIPRFTGIICTIGPRTNSVEAIQGLVEAGMNIVRLNFSHGSHEYHGKCVGTVREALKKFPEKHIAIALDTKGPEIRTGNIAVSEGASDGAPAEVVLEEGHEFILTTDPEWVDKGCKEKVFVDCVSLPESVAEGMRIFVDDGLISLDVTAVDLDAGEIKCKVNNTSALSSKKGVNLPMCEVDLPAVSDKDKKDIQFAVDLGMDFIFASFIRKASHVEEIRALLGEDGSSIKIISKIENHEGLDNFDDILRVSDGVMVARGDLGIEIPPEKVFLAQKLIIKKCNAAGKPVICATQMLDSMIKNPRPTRAECGDVANAVLDGADCVMLSGETAKGDYPMEAVSMMANICREAENMINYRDRFQEIVELSTNVPSTAESTASAAVHASLEQKATLIVTMAGRGTTARLVSKFRPNCPIITASNNPQTLRQCQMSRGLIPYYLANEIHYPPDAQVSEAITYARKNHWAEIGDTCVVVHHMKEEDGRLHNLVKFLRLYY
eukprot:Nk52_evm86s210 gene=Nk52_evmTU86s210